MIKKYFSIFSFTLGVLAFLLVQSVCADVEIQWPNFESELEQIGLSQEFESTSIEKLQSYILSKIELLDQEAKKVTKKEDAEKLNEQADVYQLLLQFIEKGKGSDAERYAYALRALYTIKSEFEPARRMKIWEYLRAINYFSTRIGYSNPMARHLPIGLEASEKEANNLFFDNHSMAPVTAAQISEMTPIELANLDVSPNHPSAYRYDTLKAMPDPFQHMEEVQNEIVNKDLKEKGVTADYHLERSYFLQFFSKMERLATSPKIYSKDSFGQKWKVKLGNEVQSESIVNRLAARVGQKYFDLSYTSSGPSKKIMLIFKKENEEQNAKFEEYLKLKKKQIFGIQGQKAGELLADICLGITGLDQLKACFKDLVYHFDVDKFIYQSGKISNENISIVQPYLAPGTNLSNLEDKLIGHQYVIFRESNAEFGGGSWERLGSVAMGQLGAEDDRYWRGTGVFQMLIWDTDAKEDNARGVITQDAEYFENPHDLASALGSPLEVGNFNKLKIGEEFAKITEDQEAIKIRGFVAFRPKAWTQATFADGRWMAKRLALLNPEVLNTIFAQTYLPQFVREVGVYHSVCE